MAYRRKLTEAEVLHIRESTSAAWFMAALYGVSTHTVYAVRRGLSWKAAPGPRRHRIRKVVTPDMAAAVRSDRRRAGEVAAEHGISRHCVWRIRCGKSYREAA